MIRERLQVYQQAGRPLVDHYRARPTFRSIDGSQSVGDVARDLRYAIDTVARTAGVAGRGAADRPS